MVELKTGNLSEKREIWSENQKTHTAVTPGRETFNAQILGFGEKYIVQKIILSPQGFVAI